MVSTSLVTVTSLLLVILSHTRARNPALETNDISDHVISTNVNFFCDLFIKHYTKKLVEEGKTQIQIGGFERRFATKVLSMDFEGAILVDDGWVGNISTLHRTGDADMDRVGEGIELTAHMGLGELKIDFNSYDVSIMGAHQKGRIHVDIGTNSLWLKLDVRIKPTCLVTLSDLKIENLDGIRVDITNLGIFENLTDEITSCVVNEVTKWYRNYIEHTLYPELSNAIKDADLCHYLPH